jgi:L-ascorbate metabolism protein UlaG (beta-lactamase superfamily)
MGPRDAVIAAQMMKAKYIVPIHYNTRELINADANQFISTLHQYNMQGAILKS